MINWKGVAYRLNYKSEKEMWEAIYTDQKLSVSKLADQFGVSHTAIRVAMERCGIARRSRGGANRKSSIKWPLDDELLFRVELDGIPTVAHQLKLNYSTVYKHVRELQKERDAATQPAADSTNSEDKSTTSKTFSS